MTNLRMRISPSGPLDGSSPNVTPFGQFGGDSYTFEGWEKVGDVTASTAGVTTLTLYGSGNPVPTHTAQGWSIDGVQHRVCAVDLNQEGVPPTMNGNWTAGSAVEVEAVLCLGFATSGGPEHYSNPSLVALPFFYDQAGVKSTQSGDGTNWGANPQFDPASEKNNLCYFKAVTRPSGSNLFPALTITYDVSPGGSTPENFTRGVLALKDHASSMSGSIVSKAGNSITFRRIR